MRSWCFWRTSLWYWEAFPHLWIFDTDVFFNLSWLECLNVSTHFCKSVITEMIIIKMMIGCLFYLNQIILLWFSLSFPLLTPPLSFHWEFPSPVCEWPRGEQVDCRGPVVEAAAHRHHRLQEAQLAAAELAGKGSVNQGWAAGSAGSWGGSRPGFPSAATAPQSLPRPPETPWGSAASASPPTDSSGELLHPRMTWRTTSGGQSTQCPHLSQSTDPTVIKVKVALPNYHFSINTRVWAFKTT